MAGASATAPGLAALRAKVDAFPAAVTAQLRSVAWRTSRRVMERAKAKVPVDTGYTKDNIYIVEDPEKKLFVVMAGTDRPRVRIAAHAMRSGRRHTQAVTLNMLPIWLEYGTEFMQARPFMRPAADAESDRYKREMREGAEAVAARELAAP
jgi:HK97 gp10 family phage protein